MLFNSPLFLFCFLPVVVAGYWWLRRFAGSEAYVYWLTAASLLFYGAWDVRFLPFILASIVVNYAVGWCIHTSRGARRRGWLVGGIGGNLLALGYFKYTNFLRDTANGWFAAGLDWPDIILPIGISFFTFQKIAYLVDVWRGEVGRYKFSHFLLFVSFFPQLLAGPILHHREMMPQFARRITEGRWRYLAVGLSLLIVGLFKKVAIADKLAIPSTALFTQVAEGYAPTVAEAWAGALCYSMQIYFDFSGYSDMAIGLACLFGIRLPMNFAAPYKAASITDFWRRWHITLSRFLRDYLYIPLGGNRKGYPRQLLNLFLTMLLGGIWHGAGWTYLLWGALHGAYLSMHHLWARLLPEGRWRHSRGWHGFAWAITFLLVVWAWVPFRADSLATTGAFWQAMLGGNGWAWTVDKQLMRGWKLAIWLIPFVALMPNLYRWFEPGETAQAVKGYPATEASSLPERWRWRPNLGWAFLLSLLFTLVILKLNDPSEFIYFQF